jgi:hypothetical protein
MRKVGAINKQMIDVVLMLFGEEPFSLNFASLKIGDIQKYSEEQHFVTGYSSVI